MSVRQATSPGTGRFAANALQGIFLVVGGLLVGAGLAAVGAKFGDSGPIVILALVAIPMLGVATLLDPRIGRVIRGPST